MIIDAHQHFWSLARNDYGWLTPEMPELYRDYQPEHLLPELNHGEVKGTVLVQAAPTEEETRYLLAIAQSTDWVKGVIGWLPMDSDVFGFKLAAINNTALKGVRPMLQDEDDPEWVLKPELDAAFKELIKNKLVFEGLVKPPQWYPLLKRLTQYPELKIVIDHGAKPDIRNKSFARWREFIKLLAAETPAMCKLSGLWGEAGEAVTLNNMRPWFDTVFECFGPERIIWGSDWPVLNSVGSYQGWLQLCQSYCHQISGEERQKVFCANATRIYQL